MKRVIKILVLTFLLIFLMTSCGEEQRMPSASFTNDKLYLQNGIYNFYFDLNISDSSKTLEDPYVALYKNGNVIETLTLSNGNNNNLSFLNILKQEEENGILKNNSYEIKVFGTYTLNGIHQEAGFLGNYVIDFKNAESEKVTFSNTTLVYNGLAKNIFVKGLSDEYSVKYSFVGLDEAPVNVGSYTCKADIYKDKELVKTMYAVLQIIKAKPTISAKDSVFTYDGTSKEIVASISNNGPLSITYNGQTTLPKEVGIYKVLIKYDGNSNYEAVSKIVNLEIINRDYDLSSIKSQTFKYNGNPISFPLSEDLKEFNPTITYNGDSLVPSEIGTYEVVINLPSIDSYNEVTKMVTMVIKDEKTVSKTDDLLISQYTYLYLNNDYKEAFVELFNGTGSRLNLSDYKLKAYSPSMEEVDIELNNLTGYIENREAISFEVDCFKVKSSKYAIALYKNNELIDIIGQIGLTPKTTWNEKNNLSINLIRKPNILKPNSTFILKEYNDESQNYDISTKNVHEFIADYNSYAPEIVVKNCDLVVNYGDEGYDLTKLIKAYDSLSGEIEIKPNMISHTINFNEFGTYEITYSITNSEGVEAIVVVEVRVEDIEGPILSLNKYDFNLDLNSQIPDLTKFISANDRYQGQINITNDMISQNINTYEEGNYDVTYTVYDIFGNKSIKTITFSVGKINEAYQVEENLHNNGPNNYLNVISNGNVNVLVVPVEFSDDFFTQIELSKLELSMNGYKNNLSYESLFSYFYKASNEKLILNIDILDPYRTEYDSEYYKNYDLNGINGTNIILKEVLDYYNNSVDFTKYDNDNNYHIDALYLIYSAKTDYFDKSNFYTSYLAYDKLNLNYQKISFDRYIFSGIDLIDNKFEDGSSNINATTYISLFGSLLGLVDLYDYDPTIGVSGGLGKTDIMENIARDINPASKVILGFIDAEIITSNSYITINKNDKFAVIVSNKFDGTLFDEYFVIDFYTPSSLDYKDVYDASYGLRIYHVDAKINRDSSNNLISNGGKYISYYQSDNSDTLNPFIRLLEKNYDGEFNIEKTLEAGNNVIFNELGDILKSNGYEEYCMYDGNRIGFSINVILINENEVTFEIIFD